MPTVALAGPTKVAMYAAKRCCTVLWIRIPVSTFYVPMIWALSTGHPMLGALVFSAFGAGRAAPVLVAAKQLGSFSECQAFTLRPELRRTPAGNWLHHVRPQRRNGEKLPLSSAIY